MTELLAQLARIEAQNAEILALLLPRRPHKRYVSLDEAASCLDRSAWTLKRLCAAGLIAASKGQDGTWRISTDELERLETTGIPRLPKRHA
jgi:hypothetical protein